MVASSGEGIPNLHPSEPGRVHVTSLLLTTFMAQKSLELFLHFNVKADLVQVWDLFWVLLELYTMPPPQTVNSS